LGSIFKDIGLVDKSEDKENQPAETEPVAEDKLAEPEEKTEDIK
jgi:hypothetical protein